MDQAHDTLSKPDIQVTNEGDKEKQLKKLAKLDGVCVPTCVVGILRRLGELW